MATKVNWPKACIGCGTEAIDAEHSKEENRWEAEERKSEHSRKRKALWATTYVCDACRGQARRSRLQTSGMYFAMAVVLLGSGLWLTGDEMGWPSLILMGVGVLFVFPAIHHLEQGSHLFYYEVHLGGSPEDSRITLRSEAFRKLFLAENPDRELTVE